MNALIRWLAPEEGVYNDWRLISTTSVPEFWIIALAILLAIALVLSALGASRLSLQPVSYTHLTLPTKRIV